MLTSTRILQTYNDTSYLSSSYGPVAVVRSGTSKDTMTVTHAEIEFDTNEVIQDLTNHIKRVLDSTYQEYHQPTLDILNNRYEAAKLKFAEKVIETKIDLSGERDGKTPPGQPTVTLLVVVVRLIAQLVDSSRP